MNHRPIPRPVRDDNGRHMYPHADRWIIGVTVPVLRTMAASGSRLAMRELDRRGISR